MPVRLRVGTEIRPSRNQQVGIHAVHRIYHLLVIAEFRIAELHGVPQIVPAPILPILHHTIEGHFQTTVLCGHAHRLVRTRIPLFALEVTVSPQGNHGDLPGQHTHLTDSLVSVRFRTFHEIIIHTVTYCRFERHAIGTIAVSCRRGIIPKQGITLSGMNVGNPYRSVSLYHIAVGLITVAQIAILQLPQSVKPLHTVRQKGLLHTIRVERTVLTFRQLRCPQFLT